MQAHPSAAAFPGGESMAAMAARAVEAVRRWDARVEAEHGPEAVWVAVSHGDVIKAVLADALGMHLDAFQRIVVDPASLSVVRYTPLRPFVVAANTAAGDLSHLKPPPRRRVAASSTATPPWVAGRARQAASPGLRAPPRLQVMATVIHSFDPPERFVAGTVGPPGQRTFFLQARSGARVTTVALEKQQVSVLAERIDELLDELIRTDEGEATIPAVTPVALDDNEPLEQPIVEEFRAGTMTLAWDATDERIVIEVFPYAEESVVEPGTPEEEIDDPEPEEMLVVRLPAGSGPGVHQARPGGRLRRPSALLVLRRPGRPRRASLPARQRLPSYGGMTAALHPLPRG